MRAIVVGAGILGLCAARELAGRGHRVQVVDRLGSGHPATSSAGATRTFRLAYAEPGYVRLAVSSLEHWRHAERETGQSLLVQHGQVEFGPPVAGIARALEDAGVAHALLDDAAERFPELSIDGPALWHPDGGVLLAPACLRAEATLLAAAGGELTSPERALVIEEHAGDVTVRTERRTLRGDVVVIAAGPWSGALLAPLGIAPPLAPGIAQVTFFEAPALVERPTFGDWSGTSEVGVYGHPVPGVGYKLGFDAASAEPWDADAVAHPADEDEVAGLLSWMERHAPGLPRRPLRSERHPWTMTPDGDPALDRRGRVVFVAGCSGHAFKLAPGYGRALADLAEGRDPGPDVAHLRLDRPALQAAGAVAQASAPIPR